MLGRTRRRSLRGTRHGRQPGIGGSSLRLVPHPEPRHQRHNRERTPSRRNRNNALLLRHHRPRTPRRRRHMIAIVADARGRNRLGHGIHRDGRALFLRLDHHRCAGAGPYRRHRRGRSAKIAPELCGALVTVLGVSRQPLVHDRLQLGRPYEVGAQLGQRLRAVGEAHNHRLLRRLAWERQLPREAVEGHEPERIDIRPAIKLVAR